MIPIFDTNKYALLFTPIRHRVKETMIYIRATLYNVAVGDRDFREYMDGSNAPIYSPSTVYVKGTRVTSLFGVYESLQSTNLGNSLYNADWWLKVNDSYIGINKQINYNANKIVYELALNDMLQTTFRQ